MRRLVVGLAFLAACTGLATAQTQQVAPEAPAAALEPEVIQPNGALNLVVGEARTLKFQEAFKSATAAVKNVVDIIPQSDHTLTITGVEPGETVMFLQDDGGRSIYTAAISVAPSPGHLVKIYGKTSTKDFVGFYCSSTGCGRADLDKKASNGGRDPDEPASQSVTVTHPTQGGGIITRTRRYEQ